MSDSTVPRSARVIGVGCAGATLGAGEAPAAPVATGNDAGPPVADDERADLVDRGEAADGRHRDLRAVGRDLPGRDGQVVRLQHADDLLAGDPEAAILVGSRVTKMRSSRPPVRSARATPSSALISGTISVRAIRPTSARSSLPLAAIDETTTGEALMLSAWTVGSARGRQVGAGDRLVDGRGRLLDVGAVRELADDQRDGVRRRRPEQLEPWDAGDGVLDRLGDLVRDVG